MPSRPIRSLSVGAITMFGMFSWLSTSARAQPSCACDLDFKPAATLLLPYFEVDLSQRFGNDTVFVVNNALPTAILANVVIWSDLAVPVTSFNVYFTGYDQQAFDLRNILVVGQLPQTGPVISPVGPVSSGGSFPNCETFLPPSPLAPILFGVQRALTGRSISSRSKSCKGRNLGDNTARGYITIDTISQCTTSFPGDPGYFVAGGTGVATDVNALYGHYTYVDRNRGAAEGFSLVSIKANPTDPATTTPGMYTFYGRLVDWTASDNREPLATNFSADYLNERSFGVSSPTDIIVWRDPKMVSERFPCSSAPTWYPLGEEAVFEFDNQEQVLLNDTAPTSPALSKDHPLFPAAAQRIRGFTTLASAGWLYLDLNTTVVPAGPNPPADPSAAQAWVTYVSSAYQLSTGYEAVRFDSACSPLHINDVPCGGDLNLKVVSDPTAWLVTAIPTTSSAISAPLNGVPPVPYAPFLVPTGNEFPWQGRAGTNWITAVNLTDNQDAEGPGGFYTYTYHFCLCSQFSNPVLKLCLNTDNEATVSLNGRSLVPTTPPNPGTACTIVPQTPLPATDFVAGDNVLTVVVRNRGFGGDPTSPTSTGMSVSGTITATSGQCSVSGPVPKSSTLSTHPPNAGHRPEPAPAGEAGAGRG